MRKSKQNDLLDILMKSDIIDNKNKSTMIRQLITEFPLTDVPKERTVTEEKIRKYTYTKDEVDALIADAVKEAVEEAVKIDEASMAKHNREATVISMILGFTTLALFVDGLLRMLGIIPPFMDIDVNILERIVDRVEVDVIDKIKQVPIQKIISSIMNDVTVIIFLACFVAVFGATFAFMWRMM